MKLCQNVCFDNIEANSNMGHVWSKTRSPGQILGNSCLHNKQECQILDPPLVVVVVVSE